MEPDRFGAEKQLQLLIEVQNELIARLKQVTAQYLQAQSEITYLERENLNLRNSSIDMIRSLDTEIKDLKRQIEEKDKLIQQLRSTAT